MINLYYPRLTLFSRCVRSERASQALECVLPSVAPSQIADDCILPFPIGKDRGFRGKQ
jgi:hypothetical protein